VGSNRFQAGWGGNRKGLTLGTGGPGDNTVGPWGEGLCLRGRTLCWGETNNALTLIFRCPQWMKQNSGLECEGGRYPKDCTGANNHMLSMAVGVELVGKLSSSYKLSRGPNSTEPVLRKGPGSYRKKGLVRKWGKKGFQRRAESVPSRGAMGSMRHWPWRRIPLCGDWA